MNCKTFTLEGANVLELKNTDDFACSQPAQGLLVKVEDGFYLYPFFNGWSTKKYAIIDKEQMANTLTSSCGCHALDFLLSTFEIMELSPPTQNKDKYGDQGSPCCSSPRDGVNTSPGLPLRRIE